MLNKEKIEYIRELYRNIFNENADNSKEITIFVLGNPHPLRIKVEDWLAHVDRSMLFDENALQGNKMELTEKLASAHELDAFVTNFIENNYV